MAVSVSLYDAFSWLFNQVSMHEERGALDFLSLLMIASAAITFFAFTFLGLKAAYGRYSSDSALYKFSLPSRLAWFLQELPSLLIPLVAVYQVGPANIPTGNMVALAMFVSHYAQRSLVYPLLIRSGKPTPVHLFLLGVLFCSWNGYLQGFWHAKYANYPTGHFRTFSSLFGKHQNKSCTAMRISDLNACLTTSISPSKDKIRGIEIKDEKIRKSNKINRNH